MNTQSTLVKKFLLLLSGLVVFLVPTNLFLVINRELGYSSGLFIDYLVPKLYASICLAALTLILSLIVHKKQFLSFFRQKPAKFLILVLITNYCLLLLHPSLAGLLYLVSMSLIMLFGLHLTMIHFWQTKIAYWSVVFAIAFQSLLAMYQWWFQHSFAGYWFLGESNLSAYAGIAKTTVFGAERILGYGTTAHPNVLAGFLAIYLLLLLTMKANNKKLTICIFLLGCLGIATTASISGFLMLIVGLVFNRYYDVVKQLHRTQLTSLLGGCFVVSIIGISLGSRLTDNLSVIRRAELQEKSLELLIENPLGVGFTNFTPALAQTQFHTELVRFIQPVHNTLLLLLTEMGIIGFIVIIAVSMKVLSKSQLITFIILSPIMFLDHYLVSLVPGLFLLGISLSASSLEEANGLMGK